MNKRLEKLMHRILEENDTLRYNDRYIVQLLADANKNEKLQIIKKEYPKVIEIDEISLLSGCYTSVLFVGCNKDTAYIDGKPVSGVDVFFQTYDKYRPYNTNTFIRGGNHKTADFEGVIKSGISALLEKIESKADEVTDQKQKEFLENLYFTGQVIIAWAEAYAEALDTAAKKETSNERREELLQMADICRRVPRLPAASFREAIQSYYFMFMLFPDGMGRLDQYLCPYYLADVEKGVLTKKQALDLVEELFIKIFAFHGKKEVRSAHHHCVVGGYTSDGECGHNACTSLILEAITELPLWRPQVSYRVTSKTTEEQMSEAVAANCKRPDLIMFLNDDPIVNGLVSVGVERADAVNYSSSGCNETILTGCSQMGTLEGHLNVMHAMERLMNDGDLLSTIDDFDAFYKAYEEYLCQDLEMVLKYSYERDSAFSQFQTVVQSLLTDGCIDSVTSIEKGGAKYNFCAWCLTGIVNLADSLSIVRQMVFDEKRFTLAELSRFLKANWAGYEVQRSYILKNGRYFGNDDDYVDLLINKVGESVNAFAKQYTPYRGGRYLFGTLTGYELAHLTFGKNAAASLDGRRAGEPFAASIASFPGADRHGMTAFLKSAAKIDERLIQSSVVVNLKLDRALADTEGKRNRLTAVLRTYFALGGIQLQINYLSAEELIKAQQDPEHYQSLRVRVTGFSGFFTSFDKNLQDEIVNRYLHTN